MFEEELADFLGRLRYGRGEDQAKGYRHGHRTRQLTGTFGTETLRVPRARIEDAEGKVTEWRSKALPRLSAADAKGRGADRRGLSGRHQHAAGQAGAVRVVRERGQQGRRQPGLAQGEGRLGRMVRPPPCG